MDLGITQTKLRGSKRSGRGSGSCHEGPDSDLCKRQHWSTGALEACLLLPWMSSCNCGTRDIACLAKVMQQVQATATRAAQAAPAAIPCRTLKICLQPSTLPQSRAFSAVKCAQPVGSCTSGGNCGSCLAQSCLKHTRVTSFKLCSALAQAAGSRAAAARAAEAAAAAVAAAAPPRGGVDFRFSRLHELGNPERAHAATAAAQARCGRRVSLSDPEPTAPSAHA